MQITMAYIEACMSSKSGRIRPRTTELDVLEQMKIFPYTYYGKMRSSRLLCCY